MSGSSDSRGEEPPEKEPPPPRAPAAAASGDVAQQALQFLVLLGKGTLGVSGVVVVGLLVQAGHLRMLGLPLFPMSTLAYLQLAIDFFVDTARTSVSHPWLLIGCVVGGLIVAYVSLLPERQASGRESTLRRWMHHPLPYLICLAAMVGGGGLLLAHSTAALTGPRSTNLLWPLAQESLADGRPLKERPGAWAVLLHDSQIRWCLLNRGRADVRDPDLAGAELTECDVLEARHATASLEAYYAKLVGVTALMLLLYAATRGARRRLTTSLADRANPDRSSLLLAADILLEIPALIVIGLLLIALPADYGALLMPTTRPLVCMRKDGAESDSAFLMSPAASDAKSVCVLNVQNVDNSVYSCTLEAHSFDPQAGMRVTDYRDILQVAQERMATARAEAASEQQPAQAQTTADLQDAGKAQAAPAPVAR